MDQPKILVTLKASGVNRDGIRIEASVECTAQEYEKVRRKLEDVLYRNDAQPVPEEAEEPKQERKSGFFS